MAKLTLYRVVLLPWLCFPFFLLCVFQIPSFKTWCGTLQLLSHLQTCGILSVFMHHMDVLFLREILEKLMAGELCDWPIGNKNYFLLLLCLLFPEVEPRQDKCRTGFHFASGKQRTQQTFGIPTTYGISVLHRNSTQWRTARKKESSAVLCSKRFCFVFFIRSSQGVNLYMYSSVVWFSIEYWVFILSSRYHCWEFILCQVLGSDLSHWTLTTVV